MNEIHIACNDAFQKRQNDNIPIRPPDLDTIRSKIEVHKKIFQAQDAVYSHLRILHPTTEEKAETRKRIRIMERLWHEMGLSETPKAHLIFKHAADDQDMFGGLGDKVEDPIETRHQEQMQIDSILSRMQGGFWKKMKTQQRYEWRNNNPRVLKQIRLVRENSKRKMLCTNNNGLTTGELNQKRIKEEGWEACAAYMVSIEEDMIGS